MRSVKISWTQLRKKYEKKTGGSGRSSGRSMQESFFLGNTGDQLTRLWLERQDVQMSDLIPEAIEAASGGLSKKSGSDKFLTPAKVKQIHSDFIAITKRLQPMLEDYILPFEYMVPHKFDSVLVIDDAEVHLVGEMDFFVWDENGYGIFDLKITENPDYWRSTVAQLTFYDIAASAQQKGQLMSAGLLQPMCSESFLPVLISPQDRREMFMNIARLAS